MAEPVSPLRRPRLAAVDGRPRPAPADAPAPSGDQRPAASLTPPPAAAFRQAVLPHLSSAYNLARYLTRDSASAEDIVQGAMLKACAAFAGYRGGSPKAWLFAIVRNDFLTWARGRRQWDRVLAPEEAGLAIADTAGPAPDQVLILGQDIAALRAAIERLPEPFRETLVLRDLEQLSYREVAEVIGAPIGTVMSRLARARQMLMDHMMEASA